MKKKLAAFAVPVLLLAACGGASSSDTTTADTNPMASDTTVPAVQKFTLTIGENSGRDQEFYVPLGAQVELTIVNPAAADEVHLHDYDISTGAMKKGESAVIAFTADKAGAFEVESHVTEELLLTVHIGQKVD